MLLNSENRVESMPMTAMMNQKSTSLLPLVLSIGESGTPDEIRVVDEWRKQLLVIWADKTRNEIGQKMASELFIGAVTTFDDVLTSIAVAREKPRPPEEQKYFEEIATVAIQLSGKTLMEIAYQGVASIREEMMRPLYPEPELNFWQKLLG